MADIIYTAEDFTFTDSGWSFDGGTFSIMSGFTGDITPANVSSVITQWDLSFTSPEDSYTLTHMNSTVSYIDSPAATNLFVSPYGLTWPSTVIPGPGNDHLIFQETTGLQSISYAAPDGVAGHSDMRLSDAYALTGNDQLSIENSPIGQPVTIASVPEPNAFLCLSLVGCVGVGRRWWRNHRTQILSIHS